MKPIFFTIFLAFATCLFSCTERYIADIDTNRKVLVVDGFLNNIPGNNFVKLSTTMPYNSKGTPSFVRNARVFVEDDSDSLFLYREYSPGYYIPVNPLFAAVVNKSYILTVETPDGEVYQSNPGKMLPVIAPSGISGGYNTKEILEANYWGSVNKVVREICEIYFDYKSEEGEIPRFRYTSTQIIEYIVPKELITSQGPLFYIFYCWITAYDNSLRFTNEKYLSKSGGIKKQTVCSTTADGIISVPDMNAKNLDYDDTIIEVHEHMRIIKLRQYRLNPDSYLYYKGIESQSEAGGKMFDPQTSQLYGNMICLSDPEELVLGFFEVSTVSAFNFSISRKGLGTPVEIKDAPDISPPSQGFSVNKVPDFWIF